MGDGGGGCLDGGIDTALSLCFLRSFILYEFNKQPPISVPRVGCNYPQNSGGICELYHLLNAPPLASRSPLILSENVNYSLKRCLRSKGRRRRG